MDSLFQIAANAAVVQDLAAKGVTGVTNSVVQVVQKSRDAKDLRSAGKAMVIQYDEPSTIHGRYVYAKIPNSTTIRLLLLEPGQKNEPICCKLSAVDLDASPIYEAISYCWGGPLDERKIMCGQGILPVTKNLYDALHRFRDPEKPRTLWADAICINQEDLVERTQQVPLMRRIYEQCSRCIVWLGVDDQDDFSASQLLNKISQLKAAQRSQPRGKPWSRLTTTPHQWASFRKLLDRPWFIRMWTLQEIILPQKAIILCGKYEWEVDDFFGLVKFVHDNQGEEDLGGVSYGMQQCLKVAAGRELRYNHQASASQNGLLEILRDARERDAGDKRDKVFAVLGLCKEEDAQAVRPNYEDTLAEVYTRAAKLILESTEKPLRLLSAAGLGERSNEELSLASWIPDWSCRTTLTTTIRSFEECGIFSAGGSLRPDIRFFSTDGSYHLQLKGKFITQLYAFIDINDPGFKKHWQEENYPIKSTKEKIIDMWAATVFGPCLADDEPRSLQQWFVMQCSRGYESRHIDETENYEVLWKMMSREMGAMDALEGKRRERFKEYAWPPSHSKEEGGKKLAPFLHDLGVWTQSRKFCKGVNRSIGWAPLEAQKGDFICVFQGSELPHVLRKGRDGKSFYLVGHCYFQGVMHGEVGEGAGWQDIVLQ
jgi:hypothetical protein